jgi:ferredoxin
LLATYKKFPNRLADEVYFTVHPASLFAGETFAKRLIASCTQCGACRDACPRCLDIGDLFLTGRRALHEKGKFPWAFHQFWLDDMDHAMGAASFICRSPLGASRSDVAYFPGCQIGGSDPRYVLESYRWILSEIPDAALWLSCCGVPAVWSGDEGRLVLAIETLRADWERLGRPELIFACPTCENTFARYLPEMKGRHLLEYMAELDFSPRRSVSGERYAVFDPCASRHNAALREAARDMSRRSGATLEPIGRQDDESRCCSWGGHISIANPSFAHGMIKSRIEQCYVPYIAYCSNCRDIFAYAQKPCVHLLDILFDLGDAGRAAPSLTQRRDNRAILKQKALLEFWKERILLPADGRERLIIDEALQKKMSEDRILMEDAVKAVDFCERTGRTVTDSENGSKTGYAQIGHFTFWVTYRPEGERIRLLKAYGHRMSIRMEETWNGQKVNDDL